MLATFVVTSAVIGGVFYLNDYYEASITSVIEDETSITYTVSDLSDSFYEDPSLFFMVLENNDTYLIEPFNVNDPSGMFTNLSPNTPYQLKLIIQDNGESITIVETSVKTIPIN